MKKGKESAVGLILCLLELIAGIMLLINPVGLTSWIIRIAGIALVAMGALEVIKYFRTDVKEASLGQTLAKGLLALLVGGFCMVKTEWFLATFPILTIIYGVAMLLGGMGKIQFTVDMLRQKNKKWFWAAIDALISVICAIVILGSPFSSTVVLWIFTGISLIAEAVLDFVALFFRNKFEEENV